MDSSTTPAVNEAKDESIKINVYDDSGYLPIHRAAFYGHEATMKYILDEAEKREGLTRQLEAITHDTKEFTPLLLAAAVGRLEAIACLLNYPVNYCAVDAKGHDMVAIAALSLNERTLRYIIDLPIASTKYNVWKSLLKLFLSVRDEESIAAGRMLELLTHRESEKSTISQYWLPMLDNGLLPALLQIFYLSQTEDLLISALLILLSMFNELPQMKTELDKIKNAYSSILKHTRSNNTQILTLLGRVLSSLSIDKSLIDAMVEQELIESLMKLIERHHSPQIIYSYFDCLSNVVAYSAEYQHKVARSKDFLLLIVEVYLEEYDLSLSLSVIRFIRQLVKNNEDIQNTLAHYGVCEHLLGALSASSKELQQVSIETIHALCHKNQLVQQILFREHAIEQLLNSLDKTNISNLQITIVSTVWTLCENNSLQRRNVAKRIGIRKLISFYTTKSDEHLFVITNAINELAKCTPSIKMNVQEEINRAQGIPYLIRLLRSNDEMFVLCVLKTIQLTSCAAGFISNRKNQEAVLKNDGIKLIVALMMHAKSEMTQVESAQSLACVALTNKQCSNTIENTLDFSYSHLIYLMQSTNLNVQLKASNSLSTFVYNNSRVQMHLKKRYRFSFDYFQKFLQNDDDCTKCMAAFQTVVLSGFIGEQKPTVNTAIGIGILMDILRTSVVDDAKSAAAECLARLAHMKSGVPKALIAVNAVDYLCDLFSSSNDATIGNASVALGFLSQKPEGRRKLMHRCRNEPDIMAFLKVYNCLPGLPSRLSKDLIDDWNRYHVSKLPELRSQRRKKRYFQVHSNNIERLRAASLTDNEQGQPPSNIGNFYFPLLRQNV